MTSRQRLRSILAVAPIVAAGALGSWACGEDDKGAESPELDGGLAMADANASTSDATTQLPSDAGADVVTDADAGVDPSLPITCKTLHANNPSLASGTYTIDLDGNGTAFPPINAYCDMTFGGGGWTMIQSFTGNDNPNSLLNPADAGPGLLIGVAQPGMLGGMSGPFVEALAKLSSQIHIRLSFQSAAGADAGTWVTSRELADGGVTRAMTNLRNLDVLTKDTDGGYEDWTGPQATAEKLSWVPLYGGGPSVCLNPVHETKYPSIYWACGNFSSMNLYAPQQLCRWTYSPNNGNEPMEVLVR